jgi:hypothetical protein
LPPSQGGLGSKKYKNSKMNTIQLFKKLTNSLFVIIYPLSLAMAGNPAEKQVQYLSGTGNNNTKTWEFYCTGGRNSGYWTTIQVPSHWEQQGFGTYNYGRDSYTYGKKFKFADEKGLYKFDFQVPADWKGKEIIIVFEGSMTDTEVKINGRQAGAIHQGAFYRFTYNITDKILFGKPNLLEVNVSKWSADKSVNDAERTADYWIFGGIFRPVYLEAYPKEYIERVAINAKADGSFSMDVFPKNISSTREIYAEIIDDKGMVVGKSQIQANQKDSLLTLTCKINNPKQWTSETPNLYKVNYVLKNGKNINYRASETFGFRTIEIRHGDGIYINGTKVKMKGINRHVWWPETGRAVNASIDLMDVKLIKEMNMNAVRCSHYPPDKTFLHYCDSLGLYVLDELAGWQDAYSTKAGAPLVKEMVIRDVNHPSVIFWSNGNEGGTNKELDDDYLICDPSKRPVIHAHHRPGNDFNGIDCNHYENYNSTKKILNDSLIYMPTEFLHCQDDGGGGAGLQDFWELMWSSPKSGGGFLWAFVDEGIVRTDLNGAIDINGVNAQDGVLGPHREKEGSFYAIREIFSPIKLNKEEFEGNLLKLKIENRFHYTNLEKCNFEWKLINYRSPFDTQHGFTVKKEGKTNISGIPGSITQTSIALPDDYKNYDAVLLSAFDPFHNKILDWTWKIRNNAELATSLMKPASADSIKSTETDSTLTLKANNIAVTFSKRDGKLLQIKTDTPNQLSFRNGPVLVAGDATPTEVKHFKENDGYVLEAKYSGNLSYIRWKMHGNGWLSLSYSYSLQGKFMFTGITFDYPEAHVLSAKWLGNGPYRVWKNRPQGGLISVWENAYNNTQTGYSPWIYPEFKGYYSNLSWMELNTVEGKFYMVTPNENIFVRLFDFYAMPGIKNYPELPAGNISFLDCIPPIGTKMAVRIDGNASILGPMSNMNEINNTFERNLYFYFGSIQE